jgi:hypothetical protein
MANHLSDYEDFSGEECHNLGLETNFTSIGTSALKYLNYTTGYVRNWGIDEAFRETYQNW